MESTRAQSHQTYYEQQVNFYTRRSCVNQYFDDKEGGGGLGTAIAACVGFLFFLGVGGVTGNKVGGDIGERWAGPTSDADTKKSYREWGETAGEVIGSAIGGFTGAAAANEAVTYLPSFDKWYENKKIVPVMAKGFKELVTRDDAFLNQNTCLKTGILMQEVIRNMRTNECYDASVTFSCQIGRDGCIDVLGNGTRHPIVAFKPDYHTSMKIQKQLERLANRELLSNDVSEQMKNRIRQFLPDIQENKRTYFELAMNAVNREYIQGNITMDQKRQQEDHITRDS